VDEAAVAAVAEEHGCELLDWSWEAVGYGREDRAEGLFEGLHGGRSIGRWWFVTWIFYREVLGGGSACV
jgi:hypothetical protein